MTSFLPLAGAVDALSSDTITVERRSVNVPAYDATGAYIPQADVDLPTPATIVASVTPAIGRQLDRLPEGRRTGAGIRIITTGDLQLGDVVTWNGRRFEVGSRADWSAVGGFIDCLATQEVP